MKDFDRILLAHGAGGRLTQKLISETLVPALSNPFLAPLADAAVLPEIGPGRPAMSTDGFVVDPPFFPGGDVGHLSVCGTVNDLAMVGARPLWLTWSLILEEGLERSLLERCVASAATTALKAGITIVGGDTKVVPRGKGDRIFVISAGVGLVPPDRDIGDHRMQAGDAIVVSGPLGDHGATIMACRHDLLSKELLSDAMPVNALVEALFEAKIDVHTMHDPTRGGLINVCHESAERTGLRMVLEESEIPIRPQVHAVCELLGLEALGLACEGRFPRMGQGFRWAASRRNTFETTRRRRSGTHRKNRREKTRRTPRRHQYSSRKSTTARSLIGKRSTPNLLMTNRARQHAKLITNNRDIGDWCFSQAWARARHLSSDQGEKSEEYWGYFEVLQRRAGGKGPLAARLEKDTTLLVRSTLIKAG